MSDYVPDLGDIPNFIDDLRDLEVRISEPEKSAQAESFLSRNDQREDLAPQDASSQQPVEDNAKGSTRRRRTVYPPNMVAILEEFFSYKKYPDIYEREYLAGLISQDEHRIQIWFQNRRAKAKKEQAAAAKYAEHAGFEGDGPVPGANAIPGAIQIPGQMNESYACQWMPMQYNGV